MEKQSTTYTSLPQSPTNWIKNRYSGLSDYKKFEFFLEHDWIIEDDPCDWNVVYDKSDRKIIIWLGRRFEL